MPVHLPARQVVVSGRRGAVGDLHIVLRAKLEIALRPRRAVLRPLPFIAMGEQHPEAAGAQPLGLARRDELVRSAERREGKSVSVSVDLGGRRTIKKKN